MSFIEPMLLGKLDAPFIDKNYIHEPKYDGHRIIISHLRGLTRLYTRHNNECSRQYPELLNNVPTSDDVVLDGEVVRIPPGKSNFEFEAVMDRFRLSNEFKISLAAKRQPVVVFVWDILFHNGKDLRKTPLIERKHLLSSVLSNNDHYMVSPFYADAISLFEAVKKQGLEGICSKPSSSPYVSGERGRKIWKKIINYQYTEVLITGYRKGELGWLSMIQDERGNLKPAGIIELATTPEQRKYFFKLAQGYIAREDKNFVYLNCGIKAMTRHRGFTRNGLLRLSEFVEFIA